MQKNVTYITDSHEDLHSFLNSINQSYTLSRPRKKKSKFFIFDTFDWKLYKKDFFLIGIDEKLYIKNAENKLKRIDIKFQKQFLPENSTQNPEFNKLKKIAGIRAIFIQAKWELQRNNISIFNKKGNRICIISIEYYSYKHLKNFVINIKYGKSFNDDVKFIEKWLKRSNIKKLKTDSILYLLRRRDIYPLSYTSKIHLECSPDTDIYLALREIFEKGRDNLLANFKFIRKDYDTEFLHDFRTTTRRLKSALTQFKGICNNNSYQLIKQQLTFLQNTTNQLRDYDVDILSIPDYKNLVSEKKQKKLELFLNFLVKKRNLAFNEFLKVAENLQINESLREINKFIFNLNENNPYIPEKAKAPIKQQADLYLNKRFSKINNAIILLVEKSEDDEIHNLRLQFKKLRYALEFYKFYYPKRRINNFILRIKKLQDNLGKFNDLCVQIERLRLFKSDLKKSPLKKTSISDIFSDLIEIKAEQKQIIRNEFFILLKRFSTKRTKESFQKLFTD